MKWLRRGEPKAGKALTRWRFPRHRDGTYGIHSEDSFRTLILRERARVDRNQHCFSLVSFDVDGDPFEDRRVKALVDVLLQHVRFTDEVGWVTNEQIGVLLPETGPGGAGIFSDRVRYVMLESGESPRPRIHTYPQESSGGPDADEQMWLEGMGPDTQDGHEGNDADELMGTATAESRGEEEGCRAAPLSPEDVDSIVGLLDVPLPWWKRAFDVVFSFLALVVLTPLMLSVAALIKCLSAGPVFFKQKRIGYMGKEFMCLKFRTMHEGNDESGHRRYLAGLMRSNAPMTKMDADKDPRIIPLGGLLRQTAIDELPQLLNVLRGSMSLVGPRPCIPYEYSGFHTWQRNRVDAVPGMTGLWQVSGKNRLTFAEMMRLDIVYARRMSPWLDILIILKTPLAIARQIRDGLEARGAHEEPEQEQSSGVQYA